jgi:hypothetical protein
VDGVAAHQFYRSDYALVKKDSRPLYFDLDQSSSVELRVAEILTVSVSVSVPSLTMSLAL